MLVLKRKEGQAIVIDDGRIVVTLLRAGDGSARVRVEVWGDAPESGVLTLAKGRDATIDGGRILLTLSRVDDRWASIGIDAPRECFVLRDELYRRPRQWRAEEAARGGT
jgi:sRNA-binding carbon storage regulator CsrA